MRQTVLITGTSTGIGHATALYFAEMGWNVAATVRKKSDFFFEETSHQTRNFLLDVTQPEECENVVSEVIKMFDGIDVLVNNAGLATMGPFEEASEDTLRKQFETNFFGTLQITKAVLPHFRERRRGTVVVLSTPAGRIGVPLYSGHAASKFALEGFFESLRFEVKPFNINIRIIEPGSYRSEINNGRNEKRIPKDETYARLAQRHREALTRYEGNRKDPREVAQAIWNAVHDDSTRLRYPVGADALHLDKMRREMSDEEIFEIMGKNFEAA